MEAIAVYVCPRCNKAFTIVPNHHDPGLQRVICDGIPVKGTWVPEEAFPAVIGIDGDVTRLKSDSSVVIQLGKPELIDPAQPDSDRQTVVKPQDGDERYWDDEQEKLGR